MQKTTNWLKIFFIFKFYIYKVNGAAKALPFTDANISVTNNAGTLAVDAAQFYLTFGNAFLKLVSCATSAFGICNSTEANPSLVMNKYLPNDLFWVGGKCVSCLNGWNGLNGRCYQRFDSASINYEQAQAECKAKNASLAILSTLNKFALAKSMVLAGSGAIVKFLNKQKSIRNSCKNL